MVQRVCVCVWGGLADVARVYRTSSGPQTSRRAATLRRVFNSHFLYETNGMHKYFRWCCRPRGEDSPMRLPAARRASVPNYRVGSWIRLPRDAARRGTEASVASPVVTPLMNLCICILERGSRHPGLKEEKEDEGSSFLRSVVALPFTLWHASVLSNDVADDSCRPDNHHRCSLPAPLCTIVQHHGC